MKGIGILAFWTGALGLAAFSGASPGGEASVMVAPAETEQPAEAAPEPHVSGFSGEQLLRLRELRAWLAQRKLQRQDGVVAETKRGPLDLSVYPDRQLLTPLGQRYALGFQNRREPSGRGNPTLYIGRGSDGRIYHRLDFGNGDGADRRVELDRGAGTSETRQRVVRISPPGSGEQPTAP